MKLPISINRKVLSLDFGGSEIKIIEGKLSKKDINISKAFTVNIPKEAYDNGEILDKDTIVKSLKDSLKDNKISTDITYGIVSSSSIITREVSIPKVPEEEVGAIIGYQLEDFLPIDPEDYVVNHIVLGNIRDEGVEKLSILLMGVPKNIVLGHLNLMKEVGLKPQVLDYQGNAIAKLLNYNDLINNTYKTRDIVIACVDMGYINSKLTIIKNGKMEVTRVLDIGAKTLYDNLGSFFDYSFEEREKKVMEIKDINAVKEEFTDYYRIINITRLTINNLLEKAEMIFKYYTSRESGNNINLVLLQGGISNINGVDNLFSNYFNIPSIKLSTLDKIKWSGDLAKYSNSIGGLIRIDEVQR